VTRDQGVVCSVLVVVTVVDGATAGTICCCVVVCSVEVVRVVTGSGELQALASAAAASSAAAGSSRYPNFNVKMVMVLLRSWLQRARSPRPVGAGDYSVVVDVLFE
jgi:hypothetical protein